ncbi:MAG TPA: TatD family hydrolase [Verrucomicrobiae bacterium]|nr:TatD family hydrolase [Verrucomicrobiae bacterium]
MFYDTHAHINFPDFADDLPQVVARAKAAGISKVICIGTNFENSAQAIEIAERFPDIYATVGWHPTDAMSAPADLRPALRELAKHPKVVAIGEIGIDHHHLPSEREGFTTADDDRYKQRQKEIFQQQLEVAAELGLNCVVHARDAFDVTLAQLKPFAGRTRGVLHCFSENATRMKQVLEIGSLVSFTGIVSYKNLQFIRDTVAATPLGSFMLETDCPYLAPDPFRGKRCEPAYVKEISEVVANLKNCSLEELSVATCKTAREFFPKMNG